MYDRVKSMEEIKEDRSLNLTTQYPKREEKKRRVLWEEIVRWDDC